MDYIINMEELINILSEKIDAILNENRSLKDQLEKLEKEKTEILQENEKLRREREVVAARIENLVSRL